MPLGTSFHARISRLTRTRSRILGFVTLGAVLIVGAHLTVRESLALKPLLDQAADMGYSRPLLKEISRIFPDARRDHALEKANRERSPLSYQVLSDHARRSVEERLYGAIWDKVTTAGYQVDRLSVSYLGMMKVKVILAVFTKDLPYARVRETLARLRYIVEVEVLPDTFVGYQLAQLSTFTVLNRRNGKVFEYPVLSTNIELPWSMKSETEIRLGDDDAGMAGKDKFHEDHRREPAAGEEATTSPAAEALPPPPADQGAARPRPIPTTPGPASPYLMEDFLGGIEVEFDSSP